MQKYLFILSFVLVFQESTAQDFQDFGLEREWGTYFGGMQSIAGAAMDSQGNIFIAGRIEPASNFDSMVTLDAENPVYGGGISDGFLVKFSASGELLYATYLGGEADEGIRDVAIDSENNVYIAGFTGSITNIATPGGHQSEIYPNSGASGAAFLVKFSNNGEKLWGTYYGGEYGEYISDIAIKGTNIYLVGRTSSQIGIATPGTFRSEIPTPLPETLYSYAFLAKFDLMGNRLWGTYYGADNVSSQFCHNVVVGSEGNIYIAGFSTDDSGYFSTPGAYMEQNPSSNGAVSVFLAKFTPDGTQRLWGTYYGGESRDDLSSLIIDENDNLYGAGTTFSQNLITTPGSYMETSNGNSSVYMFKMNAQGQRIWGTYVDGDSPAIPLSNTYANILTMDKDRNHFFLCYETENSTGVSTPGAYQENLNGPSDGYLLKFDLNGNRLWGTYYGGEAEDAVEFVLPHQDTLYFGGVTKSSIGIATLGSFQENFMPTPGSTYDINGFLVKFVPEELGNSAFSKNQTWILYPNPNKGDFYIRTTSHQLGMTNIKIYSLSGQLVYREELQFGKEQDFVLKNILSPGLYFVKLISGHNSSIFKMVLTE